MASKGPTHRSPEEIHDIRLANQKIQLLAKVTEPVANRMLCTEAMKRRLPKVAIARRVLATGLKSFTNYKQEK